MYRAVFTLLVVLMLSLGGGASALTFKSDGSVVQKDGRLVENTRSVAEDVFSARDIVLEGGFPTFRSKILLHCHLSDGKTFKDQTTVYYDENHLLGFKVAGNKTYGYFGFRSETDAFQISLVHSNLFESDSYQHFNFSWNGAPKDGFNHLQMERVWAFQGKLKTRNWKDCGVSFPKETKRVSHIDRTEALEKILQTRNQAIEQFSESGNGYTGNDSLEVQLADLIPSNKPADKQIASDQKYQSNTNDNGSGAPEVQVPKNFTAGVGSSPVNGTTPKLRDLIAKNSALLKETEIYSSLLSANLSHSSKSWNETWGVIVMHDQLLAFQSHQKGKKFVFGVQHPATPLRLEGYDYYAPNNNMAKISLSGDLTNSFIAAVANRDTFSGHVNWSGKWRQKIELKAASSSASIKSDPHYDQKISEVIEPEALLKVINERIKKLQRLEELQRDFETFLSKKGLLQASVGKDITPKVQELQRFKKNLTDLIQNNVLIVANEKAVGSDDTVNEITTAKPKEERKAKEAEALRLAKLEEERKAKEAEARRLAKQEEERKAKEAEARRLAELEEERKAKEAEALRLAKLEEERKANEAEASRLAKLEEERKAKEAEARRLAKLEEERKAKEAEARRLAEADKSPPKIFAEVVSQDGYDALIRGVITDDTGLQDMAMNGQLLEVDEQGVFETSVYIPRGGELVVIEALDKMGKLSRFELPLERKQVAKLQLASFEKLSPSNRRAKLNQNAVAVIIGVAEYQRTEVPAVYADQDAKFFYDYATLKLGVPEQNIIELVNDKANEIEIALAIENFLKRRIKRDVTDVYIFYAGHGLATDDGSEMYLLPYDGAPQLLERTAISRKQLFNDIAASNPKSVTVFLDTCYSGTTRGTETLIASRPIAIKARQQDIPEGFTVMTAAAGDQTAKPLEEAKHGMFSYFLMKGMEGDADANQDNQITADELHAYVQQNVIQQSSGSQTPQLQGDSDRVLVRFQ